MFATVSAMRAATFRARSHLVASSLVRQAGGSTSDVAIISDTNPDRVRYKAARAIPKKGTSGRKDYRTPITRSEAALQPWPRNLLK